MNPPIDPTLLQPGDLLVFSRRGLFDWIIKVKTWSQATHTELYIGNNKTLAARNGQGAAMYGLDLTGLYMVLRPQQPFDLVAATSTFYANWNRKPYGWLALFSFVLIDLHDMGVFCSELSTLLYRAGKFEPFRKWIEADKVAPADYTYTADAVMKAVWTLF
jgi:hypothetical protein